MFHIALNRIRLVDENGRGERELQFRKAWITVVERTPASWIVSVTGAPAVEFGKYDAILESENHQTITGTLSADERWSVSPEGALIFKGLGDLTGLDPH